MSWFWLGFGTRGGEWEKGDTSSCSLVCLFILGGICHTPGDDQIPASWNSLPMSPASPDCENVLSLFQPCSRPSTLCRARKTWHRPSSASFMLHKDTSVREDSCFWLLGTILPCLKEGSAQVLLFCYWTFLKAMRKAQHSESRERRAEQTLLILAMI